MRVLFSFYFLLSICVIIVFPQENPVQSQKKMMVRRAAILDAYRQLLESIKGVKISSQTTVKDFILQNEAIESKLGECTLSSAQVVATRYMPDGTCEVDMVLNINDLLEFLKKIQNQYQFESFRNTSFNEIPEMASIKYIRATGIGVLLESMSKAQLQNLQNESSILKEEIGRLKQQFSDVQTFQENFLGFLEENKELKKQLQKLQTEQLEELNSYKQREHEFLKEIENFKKDIQESRNMMAIYQGYQEQYQKSLAENRELKQQILQSKEKLQESKKLLENYSEHKAKYEELQKKYQKNLEEIENFQKQISELKDLKERITNLIQEINKFKKENKDLKTKLTKQEYSLRELENLKKQKEHFVKEKAKLINQIEQDQNTMGNLQIQNAQLQSEIEQLKRTPVGIWIDANPEQKILARRAAQNNAYCQLLENLKNIRIDSKTIVKDFALEKSPMYLAMEGFVQDAKMIDIRYMADGTCEVDMMIAFHDFIRFLKESAKNHEIANQNFDQMVIYNSIKQIKVTGCGTYK